MSVIKRKNVKNWRAINNVAVGLVKLRNFSVVVKNQLTIKKCINIKTIEIIRI